MKPSSRNSTDRGIDTDLVTLGLEFVAYIVDRQVFLAQGHDQLTYWVTGGRALRAVVDML